jgi:hypothetical protein
VTGYRLQALLDLRAGVARAARGRLAEALARLDRAGAARDEAAAAVARMAARRLRHGRSSLPGAAPAAELAMRSRHVEALRLAEVRLAGALRTREAERALAEERAGAVRAALADARGALRALEGHRASWEAGLRRARERREDAALDEVAASRAATSLSGTPGRPSRCLPGTRR